MLTFCIMSNHVYVLVHMAKRPEQMPDDAELVRLVRRGGAQECAARDTQNIDPRRGLEPS